MEATALSNLFASQREHPVLERPIARSLLSTRRAWSCATPCHGRGDAISFDTTAVAGRKAHVA